MNFRELFRGGKTIEAAEGSLHERLRFLHDSSKTSEELESKLEQEPFAQELMKEIAQVNRGINVKNGESNVCYLIDKLKWADASTEQKGGTPTYSFTFSTRDAVTGNKLSSLFEYIQNSRNEHGDLLIRDVRSGKSLGIDDLKITDAPVHLNGEEQVRFFTEIKDTIAKFVKERS